MPVLTNDTITLDDTNQDEDVEITDDEYHDAEPMDDDDFFAQSETVVRSGKIHEE